MKNNKAHIFLLVTLFLFMFSLRFIHLGADPPKTLSISMGYMSDPGGYVHNARNKILFGTWETDKWNMMYVSPLAHYIAYAIFFIFGPGIAQMNLVPVLFSCLILLFTYFVLKDEFDRKIALLGVLLLGTNYVFTMFSQVAVRIMPMVFFVLLGLFFLSKKKSNKKTCYFLAGAMCFISFTVKGTFLQILPSFALGILLYSFFQNQQKIKPAIHALFLFGLGLTAIMLFWLLLIYFPHKETFLAFGSSNYFWLTPHRYSELIQNFWHRPLFYFLNMPILTALGSLYLLSFFYRAFSFPKKISVITWICGFWVVFNIPYFSVIYYRPARHLIPLILPITFLAISLLHNFLNTKTIHKPRKIPALFFIFFFFWQIFAFSSLIILISRPTSLSLMQTNFYLTIGLSLLSTVIAFVLFKYWPEKIVISLPKHAKNATIAILVIASVFINFKNYLNWAIHPRFDRKNISIDLGKAFDHMNIGGLVALILSLENKHKAHAYSTGYINQGLDFIEKYNITHALLTTHAEEIPNYKRDFPQYMNKAKLLARYPLWKTYVELFDLNPQGYQKPQNVDIYEGEIFYGENSIPRFSENASGRLAFLLEKSKTGSLLKLPIKEYEPGVYRLTFRLKKDNSLPENERVARIDVVHAERKKVLAYKNLYSHNFLKTGTYENFFLEINLRKTRKLTLRIYSSGKAILWVDKVTIERLKN